MERDAAQLTAPPKSEEALFLCRCSAELMRRCDAWQCRNYNARPYSILSIIGAPTPNFSAVADDSDGIQRCFQESWPSIARTMGAFARYQSRDLFKRWCADTFVRADRHPVHRDSRSLPLTISPPSFLLAHLDFFLSLRLFQSCEQSGHQPTAVGETVDFDMFVKRVCIGTANAQAVERRNSERAGEVGVGAAPLRWHAAARHQVALLSPAPFHTMPSWLRPAPTTAA